MAAQVGIEVSADVAEALEALDGPLVADSIAFESVLRWNVHAAHEALWELSEQHVNPEPGELRQLAARLEVLAAAYEAVA